MTLAFPNPSRTFDDVRSAVCFFGYDGVSEIRFFVEVAVLARGRSPGATISEAQCLVAFDAMRSSIHDVAREAYSNRRINFHTLKTSDFG